MQILFFFQFCLFILIINHEVDQKTTLFFVRMRLTSWTQFLTSAFARVYDAPLWRKRVNTPTVFRSDTRQATNDVPEQECWSSKSRLPRCERFGGETWATSIKTFIHLCICLVRACQSSQSCFFKYMYEQLKNWKHQLRDSDEKKSEHM